MMYLDHRNLDQKLVSRTQLNVTPNLRLEEIDILRGLVICIMALDHVRLFFHEFGAIDPITLADPDAGWFFTRWITHFCAPVFVLMAGVSAGILNTRKTKKELSLFLLSRGFWLVLIEITVMSTAWTFSPNGIQEFGGSTVIILQVIWALGVSMILLAGLIFINRRQCFALALAVLVGHNLWDIFLPSSNLSLNGDPLWLGIHEEIMFSTGSFAIVNAYPFVPWTALMLLGFLSAPYFLKPLQVTKGLFTKIGLLCLLSFLVLRTADIYGDPNGWTFSFEQLHHSIIDFMNVTKYPPSLLFMLMTLGPASIIYANCGKIRGSIRTILLNFGRASFCFYVLHFYLIHFGSLLLGYLQGFQVSELLTLYAFFPESFGVSLPFVYLIWALTLFILYPVCKIFGQYKSANKKWWLSYL